MNNQEGMLAAASALGGRGASKPLCPSTLSPQAHTAPGHGLWRWTWPGTASQPSRASWHRRSHARPPLAKPAAAKPSGMAEGWRRA